MDYLNQEQIMGFIRHGLTIVGGVLIAKGWADSELMSQAVGALMGLAGVAWSWYVKIKIGVTPPPASESGSESAPE